MPDELATDSARLNHYVRGIGRDAALLAMSCAMCVAPLALWHAGSAIVIMTTTAAMVGAAMYSRLAMGRWRTAVQIVAVGFLLAMSGALPRAILVVLIAGLCASELVSRVPPRRMNFVKVGIYVAVVSALAAATGAGAVSPVSASQAGLSAIATAGGALLGPGLMLAFAPLAEWSLGHVTPMALTEWLSYDHPLLRDLAANAPGTFQHSVNVGLLADAGARAVGANPLLARVGGLYHDVGKLRAPGYFVENQSGANPHDSLEPLSSAEILRGHVTEGVALVRAHHMGRVVAAFVREHHGNGLMRLFYDKARALDSTTRPDDFKYHGPSPRSRETAIVMIADQLEATARAQTPADLAECEQIARQTIGHVVASGELIDARLSAQDLDRVRDALSRAVFAMYHRRLTYPATPPAAAALRPPLVSRLFRGQGGGA
jgi:cyclic-di-AMP phosphodiesterase PgpH